MTTIVSPAFRFTAQQLDDVEKYRKAANNQLRIFIKPADEPDEDGICRGFGYPEDDIAVLTLKNHIERLEESEKAFKKTLEKNFKDSPLAAIVNTTYGIGVPMVTRLLGIIGDPYIKPIKVDIETGEVVEQERVRTLSELFSYCGLTPDSRKKKGSTCKYNPQAQSALWVIANNIHIWQKPEKSPLKALFVRYYAYYQSRVDDKGKPWNNMRASRAAYRKVGREVLKTLYFEAQKIHETSS